MIRSFRTYRLFRALLATVLLFSISLPLVRYACAMTGHSVMASDAAPMFMAQADAAMCETPASSLHAADGLCPSAGQCQDEAAARDGLSCCKTEAVQSEKAPLTESQLNLSQVVLPLVAVLTSPEVPATARFPFLTQEAPRTKGEGVPLRVLHASFLI